MENNVKMIKKLISIRDNVIEKARKKGCSSVFTIAQTMNILNTDFLFPPIRETYYCVAGNIIINNIIYLDSVIKVIDGYVDYIYIDNENKKYNLMNVARKKIKKSSIRNFRPNDMTVDAADELIQRKLDTLHNKKVVIIGAGNIGSKLGMKLVERGSTVNLFRRDYQKTISIVEGIKSITNKRQIFPVKELNNYIFEGVDLIIGCTPGVPIINREYIKAANKNVLILDVGIGTINSDAIEWANERGNEVIRLDMRAGFASQASLINETDILIKNIMGRYIDSQGSSFVAGGVIGKCGDIVVDNISNPQNIIGVANGRGGIIR